MKKEVVQKNPAFFVAMGICIQKTMDTKKINLPCALYKKDCSGAAYIEFGKLFNKTLGYLRDSLSPQHC